MTGMLESPKGLQELLQEFEEKSNANPNDLSLMLRLGRLYTRNGAYEDAVRVFQRIIAIDPTIHSTNVELGICLIQLKQYSEARHYLDKAHELQPASSNVYLAYAKLFEALGNPEQQAGFLLKAADLASGKPEIRMYLADLLKRNGDVARAEKQYQMVLEHHPDHENAHFALAGLFIRQNSLNEAMEHLRSILFRNPSAHDAHFNLAQCLFRQGKYALAAPSFIDALRGLKEHGQARFLLAQCYFHLGEWDRSLVIMEKLAETNGDDVPLQVALGELYLKTNEWDSARDVFSRLWKAYPARSEFALHLAKVLSSLKRYSEAVDILTNLFVSHPGHLEGHRILGDIHLARGAPKAAFEEYKRTLMVNEQFLPGFLGMAEAARVTCDAKQEYAALQKASALASTDLKVLLRLGELEAEMNLPTSLDRFRKILELSPKSVQAKEAEYYIRHKALPGK